MSEGKREFRGIWFPASVWLDKRINAIEKMILLEIDSLDGESGCYASNRYLADFCQCSEATVSRAIAKLKGLGYIRIASFDGRTRTLHSCLVNLTRQTSQTDEADLSNRQERILDKITSTERTSLSGKPDDAQVPYEEVIDYLNSKSGKRYRAGTEATRKMIRARFSDGYTLDDFKHVIDVKCSQWLGTEHEKYLRPETLFRPSHFESYVNEQAQPKSRLDEIDWSLYELKPL